MLEGTAVIHGVKKIVNSPNAHKYDCTHTDDTTHAAPHTSPSFSLAVSCYSSRPSLPVWSTQPSRNASNTQCLIQLSQQAVFAVFISLSELNHTAQNMIIYIASDFIGCVFSQSCNLIWLSDHVLNQLLLVFFNIRSQQVVDMFFLIKVFPFHPETSVHYRVYDFRHFLWSWWLLLNFRMELTSPPGTPSIKAGRKTKSTISVFSTTE